MKGLEHLSLTIFRMLSGTFRGYWHFLNGSRSFWHFKTILGRFKTPLDALGTFKMVLEISDNSKQI